MPIRCLVYYNDLYNIMSFQGKSVISSHLSQKNVLSYSQLPAPSTSPWEVSQGAKKHTPLNKTPKQKTVGLGEIYVGPCFLNVDDAGKKIHFPVVPNYGTIKRCKLQMKVNLRAMFKAPFPKTYFSKGLLALHSKNTTIQPFHLMSSRHLTPRALQEQTAMDRHLQSGAKGFEKGSGTWLSLGWLEDSSSSFCILKCTSYNSTQQKTTRKKDETTWRWWFFGSFAKGQASQTLIFLWTSLYSIIYVSSIYHNLI